METTRLSSKGQVIIPKAVRSAHRWESGLELQVIDTGDGILLKPKAPFEVAVLADVSGMLKARIKPMTDAQIMQALQRDVCGKWRGSR